MVERARKQSETVYKEKPTINVYWNIGIFDEGPPAFHVTITKNERCWFGYVKQKTRPVITIPYISDENGGCREFFDLSIPMIRKYAEFYDADILWDSGLELYLKRFDDKEKQ